MELLTLKTFLAVVEEGGLLPAANKLNTVQSNVTARLKKLEQELNAELFTRQGRKLVLTTRGRTLISYAQQIRQLERQASKAVNADGVGQGLLTLGSMEAFAAFHLPQVLQRLSELEPELQLQLETDTSAALIQKVIEHKLDAAYVGGPVEHPELETSQILIEELVLVSAKKMLNPAADACLILFKEGCAYRSRAITWLQTSGNQTFRTMELGTLDGILGCISIGLGCTLMPRWLVQQSRYMPHLILKSLPEEIAKVPTVLVRRKNLPLSTLDKLQQSGDWIANSQA